MSENKPACVSPLDTRKKPNTIQVWVDVYQKPARVEFVVMRTPAPLWEILPQNPRHIPDDSTPAHYFKRFTARYLGTTYEFLFYHVRQPNEKVH